METRETKDRVDSIKMAAQRISTNIAKLVKAQEETNKKLGKIIALLEEQERKARIKDGY